MEITIKHFDGQYPSFNIMLHGAPGADPFLEIKGCKLVDGKNGPFISYPARKDEKTGKYWNHVYGGEKFNAAVIKKVQEGQAKRPSHEAAKARQLDDDSSIPF
jgi:DNA-binding cell septation regulator SpoVG